MADEDPNQTKQPATEPATAPTTAPVAEKAPEQTGVRPRSILKEMKESYMDYSMSVIVGRALPDIRDGLKPVHRRILYGMHDMGNTHDKPTRKSARIVGEVLGKYHPHGDTAVYDALVRMAQTFSLRYPLVDGQGNFGSVDGDNAAAMRYTECRMSSIADMMMADIEKDTVDFRSNFDATLEEPTVLPARLPNLLVNGSTGIAVGMATNVPPHNLKEVVGALLALIENPAASLSDLLVHIKGPDFPTGGIIQGMSGVVAAYSTGRGSIRVRARTKVEEREGGRQRIVATELPFAVNKARLIESIAELVKDKRIEGITDLRDESDRDGIRVVIELRRDVLPEIVLNQLYAHTDLQTTFGVNNLALVGGKPETLPLKDMLQRFIEFREEVVRRRTAFDLRKAQERAHILEGLLIALDNLDAVIALIRASRDASEASTGLQAKFALSELQAKAILDMRLQRLTGLEVEKVRQEYKDTLALIERLKAILADIKLILGIIRDELVEVRDKWGDERRTEIVYDESELEVEDLVPNERVVVSLTSSGYVKRQAIGDYQLQHRGGKGLRGQLLKEEDHIEELFITRNHSFLLFFTNLGRVYRLKAYKIPESGRLAKGVPIVSLLQEVQPNERVVAFRSVEEFDPRLFLVFATRKGEVKRSRLSAYAHIRQTGIRALKIEEGDALVSVRISDGGQDIILATRTGKAVRFHEGNVRASGRNAGGVRGVRLRGDDALVSMALTNEGRDVLTVTEHGFGKRTSLADYRLTARGGSGVRTIITSSRNGPVISVRLVSEGDELMVASIQGMLIRIPVFEDENNQIRCMGRATQGVRLMRLEEGDRIICVGVLTKAEEDEVEGIAPPPPPKVPSAACPIPTDGEEDEGGDEDIEVDEDADVDDKDAEGEDEEGSGDDVDKLLKDLGPDGEDDE
jgi:DNA gyrase subunit A